MLQDINLGTGNNTGDGDPLRPGGQKINENFEYVDANKADIDYPTVAAMKASTKLNAGKDGVTVRWQGYDVSGDGFNNSGIFNYEPIEDNRPTEGGGVIWVANGYVDVNNREWTFNSIDDLKNAPQLKIGDGININGYYSDTPGLGGGRLEVINDTPSHAIDINLANRPRFNLSNQINIGDRLVLFLKIKSYAAGGTRILYRTRTNVSGAPLVTISDSNSGGDFRAVVGGALTFKISELISGNIVNENSNDNQNFKFNTWYAFDITSNINFNDDIDFLVAAADISCEVSYAKWGIEEFQLNEGSGVPNGDMGGTVTAINGLINWIGYDFGNDGTIINVNNGEFIVNRIIEEGVVSISDFGARTNESVNDFSYDSTQSIQNAYDSGFDVIEPIGYFLITETLRINNEIRINKNGFGLDENLDLTKSKFATTFYVNSDINVYSIQSSNVNIDGGLVYVGGFSGYTKAAFLYDSNFRSWTAKINVQVLGNLEGHAHLINQQNISIAGFSTDLTISGRIASMFMGVECNEIENGTSGQFVNDIKLDNLTIDGCKKFIRIVNTDNLFYNVICQDRPVLDPGEEDFIGIDLDVIDLNIPTDRSVFFDTAPKTSDPVNKFRHSINPWVVNGRNVVINGAFLQRKFAQRAIKSDFLNPNPFLSIKDPYRWAFAENTTGAFSYTDNILAYAGMDWNSINVNYRGFTAPNQNWFDLNLFEADSLSNTTPLSVEPLISINSGDSFLTNNQILNSFVIDDSLDNNLSFVEISITNISSFLGTGNFNVVERLFISKNGWSQQSIQFIIRFTNNEVVSTIVSDRDQDFWDFYEPIGNPNQLDNIDEVIVRFIGQISGTGTKSTSIKNVCLKPRGRGQGSTPIINISGGQKIYGSLGVGSLKDLNGNPLKLSTTATIDYTTIDGGGQLTINAGVGDSQPVTLTGVTQADYSVKCEAVGGLPEGLTISDCYVSADDEVTIVLFNLKNIAIDPPSIDFKIIATRL